MITDQNHPHFIACANEFNKRMNRFHMWPCTEDTLRQIEEMVVEHRRDCRRGGVDWPELVVICLPRCNVLTIRHKDLDLTEIEKLVVHLARTAKPEPTAEELAFAIKRAYPHVKRLGGLL